MHNMGVLTMDKLTKEQSTVLADNLDHLLDAAFRIRSQIKLGQLDKQDCKALNLYLNDLMTFLDADSQEAWRRRVLNVIFGYHNSFDATITKVYQIKDDGDNFAILAHIKLPNIWKQRGMLDFDFIVKIDNPYMRSVFQGLADHRISSFEVEVSCDDFASQTLTYERLLTAPQIKY